MIASAGWVVFSKQLVKPGFLRTAAILTAFIFGSRVSQAATGALLIRWLIMGMLFLVFLQTKLSREASQSLGQKNTTFTIYLALTFANPLVALGPTCYVLWHSLWNSWQLHPQA
jgi:hypothetical protein